MSAAPRPDDNAPVEAWKAYASELEGGLSAAERRAGYLQQQLNRVIGSPPWRMAQRLRRFLDDTIFAYSPRLRKLVVLTVRSGPAAAFEAVRTRTMPDTKFEAWLARNALTDAGAAELRAKIEALPAERKPLISILIPVYDTPRELLIEAVNSVKAQIYTNWELCLVDDKSPSPHIRPLMEKFAQEDARVRLHFREQNGHISRTTQDALNMAKGEFFGLLDHDDVISPDALARMVLKLSEHPDAGMIYSDRDLLEMDGHHTGPYFKPDWNPDLFMSNMYLCHLGVYRTALAREVGGFRAGYEGSQDYDFVLRLTENLTPEQILHIPYMCYSWRRVPGSTAQRYDAKGYADLASRKALTDALQRRGIQGSVESGNIPSQFRVRRTIQGSPLVSILIPFRDRADYLKRCIYSIRNLTAYPNYEFILLDNGSTEDATRQLLEEEQRESRVKVIRIDEPFNYSRINNRGAREASGEHLLLLNNDTEVLEPEWLSAMLEHSQRPEVGAVGAKLLYPDGRVQHAGVIVGVGEVAGHAFRFYPGADPGYYGSASAIRNYSAVTAACMMTRKNVFLEAGGLNETDLAVAYNDVDYCLRLREKGLLIVYTPYAKLRHYESISRGLSNNPRESAYMCRRWAKYMPDPNYNPHLSQVDEDFSIGV